MSLAITFTNESDSEVPVGPGPLLVWYPDPGAQEAMENTARAWRVQNTTLVIPARGTRDALFAIDPKGLEELRCNAVLPAAAALYVYQFTQRPLFRCMLQGYDLQAVSVRPGCKGRSLGTLVAPRQ